MKNLKRSIVCSCNKKVKLCHSKDKLASGKCNRCIKLGDKTIFKRDSHGHIYLQCTRCKKGYRLQKDRKNESLCLTCENITSQEYFRYKNVRIHRVTGKVERIDLNDQQSDNGADNSNKQPEREVDMRIQVENLKEKIRE